MWIKYDSCGLNAVRHAYIMFARETRTHRRICGEAQANDNECRKALDMCMGGSMLALVVTLAKPEDDLCRYTMKKQ